MANNNAKQILSNIERYNSIPVKGIMHFGYESTGFRSQSGKWLNKAGTFKAIKTGELEASNKGVLKFQCVVLDYTMVYMISGKQVSREEWYAEAGYELSNTNTNALLTFCLHKVQGLSKAK